MKKFLFFVFKILALTFIIAVILDLIYSACYLQSNDRDKIGYICNSEPKEFDVVVLGSSRSNFHFVTSMFMDKGLETFNFGMESSKLYESDLVLKLLLEKHNKIKNVIIDVDVTLALDAKSESIVVKFLPYLHNSEVIKKHLRSYPDYKLFYYIPFYRFVKYGNIFSLRETVLCGIDKKSSRLENGGYVALKGVGKNLKLDILGWKAKRNRYYEEIKQTCKANNIKFIAIMTPMCENTKGINYFDKVQKLYPEIHNYENVVVEDKYFSSCGHMNDTGARLFTARILKDFFNK
jgi:hypothetical protein